MANYSFVDDEPAPGKGYSFVDDVPAQTPTTGSRARAGAAGINKGFFADLLGLPVDAVANVLDLGKAGFGTAASALGRPDLAPDLSDRRGTIGSSEWIARKFNDVGLGGAINNPNPGDAASRILHTGGRVAGASIVPNPRAALSLPQNLANMAKGSVGGAAAGSVGEVAPEWAGLAGIMPQAGMSAGAAALKRGVRGGESGRMAMEQRIQDLKNGGVDSPSVGLASGNRGVMGIENLLSQTPGSVGIYEAARSKNVAGMKARSDHVRDSASMVYGPVETGSAIQADLKGLFKDRIGNTYGALNDRVERAVGPNTPIPVSESILRSGQLTAPVRGAEATSSNFINARIAKIHQDLSTDAGGKPERTIYVGGQAVRIPAGHHGTKMIDQPGLLDADGVPLTRIVPATPPEGLPFSALKDLRTKIGKEAASNAIIGTPEQADFKQLYGAMSQDMRNGVTLADQRAGINPSAGGSATTALNRANTFYSRAMGRADDLGQLANRSTPEGAYGAVASSLSAGPTVYQRLRGVVSPATRQKVVSTLIDEMGAATPGQQGAAGDTWSPKTFLTNYSRMDAGARTELFKRIPGGAGMSDNLTDIAKTADMISDASKNWANPSGTAPALVARGTIGTIAAGVVGGIFYAPLIAPAATAAGGLMVANQVSKRLLLNPVFVNWLAKTPQVRPEQAQAHAQRLIANANMTNDKQFTQDVSEYLRSVEQSKEEE